MYCSALYLSWQVQDNALLQVILVLKVQEGLHVLQVLYVLEVLLLLGKVWAFAGSQGALVQPYGVAWRERGIFIRV